MYWWIDDARKTASNTEIIKCTDEVVCVKLPERLHPTPMRSDALAKLSMPEVSHPTTMYSDALANCSIARSGLPSCVIVRGAAPDCDI